MFQKLINNSKVILLAGISSHYEEQHRGSLKKLKTKLPYDLAVLLLGIYPEKTIIEKDTCSPHVHFSLFKIARTWKQPKCPLTYE